MNQKFEPFEVVKEHGRTILRLRGTEEQEAKLEADKVHVIMDAIVQGWDIDIQYANINGNLDIRIVVGRLERDSNGKYSIPGNVRVVSSNVGGRTYFGGTSFGGEAFFGGTSFTEEASFRRTSFNGEAFFGGTSFNEEASFGRTSFNRAAYFDGASFSKRVNFMEASFSEIALFWASWFNGGAVFLKASFNSVFFLGASFNGEALFAGASFNGEASFAGASFNTGGSFRGASFNESVSFAGAEMKRPADFNGVRFQENKAWPGLKNEILFPVVSRLTGGRKKLEKVVVTDFSELNTTTVMDGSSNPRLKRYIDDEQWIKSWRYSSKLRRGLFYVWEAMCHCGRSIGLWAGWSAFFALLFAFIYWRFGCDRITFNVGRLGGQQPNFLGYLYYSVVTFTTLGFGDIVPLTNWARLAVGAEVVCGYVMLGGLISILANKLARRS